MRGTQIYLQNILHAPGWNYGVAAYDDFVSKVLVSGYGRSIKGIVAGVFACVGLKKYRRVLEQVIPQLRKEAYLADILRVALRPHPAQIAKNTTLSHLYTGPFGAFDISPELAEQVITALAEHGEIRGVEFQSGLDNIYV